MTKSTSVLESNKIEKTNLITKRFRNNNNKLPVLCVTFNNKYDVFSVLEYSSMLKDFKFASDRTIAQREKINQLSKLVNEHNLGNPENKVFIKYLHGKPTIVNSNDYKKDNNSTPVIDQEN